MNLTYLLKGRPKCKKYIHPICSMFMNVLQALCLLSKNYTTLDITKAVHHILFCIHNQEGDGELKGGRTIWSEIQYNEPHNSSLLLPHPPPHPSLLFSFRQAILGQAVDRHLLGLKLLAAEAGMETPAIFNDVAYTRSLHFRLSTSQVPMPEADDTLST